jgi:hypothetical protein
MQYLHSDLELKRALIMPIAHSWMIANSIARPSELLASRSKWLAKLFSLAIKVILPKKLPKGSSNWQKAGNATPIFYANP